jgi:hypothetical protein
LTTLWWIATSVLMKTLARRRKRALPLVMADLMMASWETIARQSMMMARGACTTAEYQRMVMEKAAAAQDSALALITGRGARAALAPWGKRAAANAKRLRLKS